MELALPLQKTAGGILLPEAAQSAPNEGIVKAVGSGMRNAEGTVIPPQVKEGDRVLLPEYGGTNVKLGDKVRPCVGRLTPSVVDLNLYL